MSEVVLIELVDAKLKGLGSKVIVHFKGGAHPKRGLDCWISGQDKSGLSFRIEEALGGAQ